MKTFFCSKRKTVILLLFVVQIIFQIIGAGFYSSCPDWFWTICDALILVTPLIFGLAAGIICCIPNFVAEIFWLIMKGYLGAMLHGIAFMISVIIIGLLAQAVDKKIKNKNNMMIRFCVSHIVIFEIALIFENFLYGLLRAIFIVSAASPLTAESILKDTLSVGNPVCVVLMIIAIELVNRHNLDLADM